MIETTRIPAGSPVAEQAQRTVDRFRGRLPQQAHSADQVDAALRTLPSHGWTGGWVGRRDRALLVLSQLAGLSYTQIAALTAGELTIADGVATVRTVGGRTTLRKVDDDLLCGPCALARWVHALDLTVVYPEGRVIAALIARAVPVTSDSPHLCQSNNSITEPTRRVALLPPIDQWGHPTRILITQGANGRATADRAAGGLSSKISADVSMRAQALEQRVEQLLS